MSQDSGGMPEEELDGFEQRTGLTLPTELRSLYRSHVGLEMESQPGRWLILPLPQVEQTIDLLGLAGTLEGYLPIAGFENRGAVELYCICSARPYSGRIVQLFEDQSPQLLFRDLQSYRAAAHGVFGSLPLGEDFTSRLRTRADYDFSRNDQTPEDDEVGRALINHAQRLDPGDVSRTDAMRFAALLLRAESLDLLAELLNEDVHVREEVLQRLRQLDLPAAGIVLTKYETQLADLENRVKNALRVAGLEVAETSGSSVRLEPGAVWIDIADWFPRREEQDVFGEIVNLARQLIELEKPG